MQFSELNIGDLFKIRYTSATYIKIPEFKIGSCLFNIAAIPSDINSNFLFDTFQSTRDVSKSSLEECQLYKNSTNQIDEFEDEFEDDDEDENDFWDYDDDDYDDEL